MGAVGNLFEVLRDSSYQEIEDEAAREVVIGLAGNTSEARDTLHRALSTRLESLWTASPFRLVAAGDRPSANPGQDDESGLLLFALYQGDRIPAEKRDWLRELAAAGRIAVIVVAIDRQSGQAFDRTRRPRKLPNLNLLRLTGGADGANFDAPRVETRPAWQVELEELAGGQDGQLAVYYLNGLELARLEAELLPAIVERLPGRELALARRAPIFRNTVARHFINSTARSNAELVLLANLTAGIPILSGFFASGADFVVLTRNQFELSHRLAGVYGQKRDNRVEIYLELAPIIGAAFAWKSLSVMAARKFPAILALLPKAGIAYAATVIVGLLARRYYAGGRQAPTQVAAFVRGLYENLTGAGQRRGPARPSGDEPRQLRSS